MLPRSTFVRARMSPKEHTSQHSTPTHFEAMVSNICTKQRPCWHGSCHSTIAQSRGNMYDHCDRCVRTDRADWQGLSSSAHRLSILKWPFGRLS
jgi:hypothetical protein